jgi:hypothetical protein
MRFSLRDVLDSAVDIIERATGDNNGDANINNNDNGRGRKDGAGSNADSTSAAAATTTAAQGLLAVGISAPVCEIHHVLTLNSHS